MESRNRINHHPLTTSPPHRYGVYLSLLSGIAALFILIAAPPAAESGARGYQAAPQLKLLRTLKSDYIINRLAWHPDNQTLAVGQVLNKQVTIWDVESGKAFRTIDQEIGGVDAIAYSPDGRYLSVGRNFVQIGKPNVNIYDAASGRLLRNFVPPRVTNKGGTNAARVFAFSPDSRYLVAQGYGGGATCVVYEISIGTIATTLYPSTKVTDIVQSLAWSPNGHWVAVGRTSGTLEIWNTKEWKLEKQLTAARFIGALAFSADSSQLAVASFVRGATSQVRAPTQDSILPDQNDIAILATSNFEPIKHVTLYTETRPSSLTYTGHKKDLLSGGMAVKLFEYDKNRIINLMEHPKQGNVFRPSLSPDGKYLAVASGKEVKIWEWPD